MQILSQLTFVDFTQILPRTFALRTIEKQSTRNSIKWNMKPILPHNKLLLYQLFLRNFSKSINLRLKNGSTTSPWCSAISKASLICSHDFGTWYLEVSMSFLCVYQKTLIKKISYVLKSIFSDNMFLVPIKLMRFEH